MANLRCVLLLFYIYRKDHLMLAFGFEDLAELPDCWVLNAYEEPSKHIDWHADDDALFDAVENQAVIVSISLGADGLFAYRSECSIGH